MPETAQQTIQVLFHNTVTDARLLYDFDLFNSSVNQKLWSTEYNCRQLLDLDISQFQVSPSSTDTQSYGSTIIPAPMLDITNYCCHINLYLDGFFMNALSALDTLAHEIYILYESRRMPSRVYINTAKQMLLDDHPSSALGALLDSELNKPWFIEFEPFRHCTTHESLIRHNDIVYRFDPVVHHYKLSRRIKLPDNPQIKPFTYDRNRVATEYLPSTFKRIHKLVTEAYRKALRDIQANGNVLPVPAT